MYSLFCDLWSQKSQDVYRRGESAKAKHPNDITLLSEYPGASWVKASESQETQMIIKEWGLKWKELY